jgi:RNA polymerase primary sigma factor
VVQELYKEKKNVEKTGKDINERFDLLPKVIDLDRNINEEGDTLVDMIENKDAEMPDASFNDDDTLKEKLISLLGILDDREKVIIEDYFGLSGSPRTLEDIGEDFSLTKERIRQIKQKALRKLRNESTILFDYL